ncbi:MULTISPECIES: ComF family protein [Thermus]|uniref:ComF family protein n=1 Tax=Thermus TaxID=270 RepID=UPI003094DDD9
MPWAFLEALLGHRCPGCGGPLDRPLLCTLCRGSLRPFRTDRFVYLGLYGRVGGLVRALKYGGRWGLAPVLAEALALGVEEAGWPLKGVTAVPTLLPRLLRRGYNPPDLLARALAARLGLPYRPVLYRARYAPSRPLVRGRARARLPEGLFRPRGRVEGAWLLVDDVLTSGATFLRAEEALLEAGAERVYGAFIALKDPKALGPYR